MYKQIKLIFFWTLISFLFVGCASVPPYEATEAPTLREYEKNEARERLLPSLAGLREANAPGSQTPVDVKESFKEKHVWEGDRCDIIAYIGDPEGGRIVASQAKYPLSAVRVCENASIQWKEREPFDAIGGQTPTRGLIEFENVEITFARITNLQITDTGYRGEVSGSGFEDDRLTSFDFNSDEHKGVIVDFASVLISAFPERFEKQK